jgi:hypothetical protein
MSFEAIRARLTAGVPFAAHCGVSLDKLDRGSATATLPFRQAGLNHIGTHMRGRYSRSAISKPKEAR